jgi:T5SS/PEP-CTERM-associated repeat protein/autotransporter-associated beta strand protein
MNLPPLLFCLAALLAMSVGSTLRAQTDLIVGNNSTVSAMNFSSGTNTYSNAVVGLQSGASNNRLNITNTAFLSLPNISSSLLVGSNGSGNILLISNTARVRSAFGYVGFASNSANNSAVVTGSGAAWTNFYHLYVGNAGTSNSLVISNGGRVRNQRGYLGFSNTSSGNSALVTGAGSAWTNSALLYVGDSGSSNSLVISNGGQVAANLQNTFTTSIGRNTNSANNSALVTGSNSLWTNTGDLHVGNLGSGNSMVVSDGGQVINVAGYVGSGAAASNNSALVTGSNSLWTTSGDLNVGYGGSGNSLTIADGGTVAASNISIASQAGSSGTLNIGRFGTNDAAGTISAPTIAFGDGTGTINFNQSNSTTISAAISGAGTVNQLGTGTTTLSGANTYTGDTTIGSGVLTLTNGSSIADTAAVTNSGATLRVDSSETIGSLRGSGSTVLNGAAVVLTVAETNSHTYAGVISGAGGITKSGIGRLSLSGSSSYNGATAVSAGELNLSGGSIANSAVTVASGASLSGYGSVGTIGGAGAINPGNSPGILTTPQVNPSAGTTFNFEMTGTAPIYSNAASSVNDLIRITGGTPFSPDLAGNGINIYFSGDALFTGSPKTITGGFFTDQSTNFASSITNATYNYYFADAIGTNSYNGVNYYNKAQYESLVLGTNMLITVSTVAQTANFGSGNVNGQVMQIDVIPEPSTYALLVLAVAGWGVAVWRRRKQVS